MVGRGKAKTVDDLLSGAFLDGAEGEDSDLEAPGQIEPEDIDEDDDESEIADDESFASLDDQGAVPQSHISHCNLTSLA